MPDLLRLFTLIWDGILRLIAGQLSLTQAINRLYDQVTGADLINALAGLQTDVTTIKETLQDSGIGLQAIVDKLDTLTATDTQTIQTVLSAIAALPAGSDIVIPPAGDNAEAVWLYQGDFRDQTGNMLSKLDETNFKLGPLAGYLAPGTPWFGLYYPTSFAD